jgi:NADH-quinone oxidoreductase subunit C
MTPEEVGACYAARLGADAAFEESYGAGSVEVPVARWVEAATLARDELDARFFDWLSAYDELEGGFALVVHLWSVAARHQVLLRTRVPREDPRLPTLTGIYRGANWHERETFEMFGVIFDGHPNLVPLLLPDGFEGYPLRKEFVLASRVAKAWPGAKDPADSESGAPGRRRMQPPGVPDPDAWGPEAVR